MAATADDIATGGSMAKTMIFSTTPSAADGTTPMRFTITVISRNDTFISASCSAMGAPNFSTRLDSAPLRRMSCLVKAKLNPRLRMNHSAAPKLMPCAATVAMAAPAARSPHAPTSTKSAATFITHARATKYSGVCESPRPRSMPHTTL